MGYKPDKFFFHQPTFWSHTMILCKLHSCSEMRRDVQGTTGLTDQVVVDFTPLHLSEADVSSLRTEVLKAVISVSGLHDEETATFGGEVPKVEDEQVVHAKDQAGACPPNSLDEPVESLSPVESSKGTLLSDGLEESSGPLRFQASSRNMAKVISEAALDAWRRFSISKAKS